jgi:hypothetical protein
MGVKDLFLTFGFATFVGLILSAGMVLALLVFRRKMDIPAWSLTITSGIWAASVGIIVLWQGLASQRVAIILVPFFLAIVTGLAIWKAIKFARQLG